MKKIPKGCRLWYRIEIKPKNGLNGKTQQVGAVADGKVLQRWKSKKRKVLSEKSNSSSALKSLNRGWIRSTRRQRESDKVSTNWKSVNREGLWRKKEYLISERPRTCLKNCNATSNA